MEELLRMLNSVEDSYFDFVSGIAHYAEKKQSRVVMLIDYIKNHPDAKSSDIIKFVSEQKDFIEDAAYMRAV